MKLKFLLLILLSPLFVYSQVNEICNHRIEDPTPPCSQPHYTSSIDQSYLNSFDPVVFSVFFWGINKDDSSNTPTINEETVLQNVANLNLEFNQYNIFFKYAGFDNSSFKKTDHYQGSSIGEIYLYATEYGHVKPNAFNIYIPYGFAIGGGQALGYGSIVAGVTRGNWNNFTGTLTHEIGHCFDLRHTWQDFNSTINCEKVTRNSGDINYNADVAGDCIPDTASTSILLAGTVDLNDCTYIGTDTDCEDTPYQINSSNVKNYMNGGATECRDRFSVGQAIRMREAIDEDIKNIYVTVDTSVASLYEPYKGEYLEYYGSGSLPNPNPPLFQPGFQYKFFECACECPEPSEYSNTSFTYDTSNVVLSIEKDESDFSVIAHPNHSAIQIKHPHPIFLPQLRKCLDNWSSPPIIGGSIVEFPDGVYNVNYIETTQDSIQINNPNLIDNLGEGLYSINKNHDNGNTTQTNIYKENN